MKILSLQISNILSFKYHQNIDDAQKIKFDKDLNILIGQNGSGKSTALEVINFVFKKVLFVQFNTSQENYSNKAKLTVIDRRNILNRRNNNTYNEFRLEPNWSFEDQPQKIKVNIVLDEIDRRNLAFLKKNISKIAKMANAYSNDNEVEFETVNKSYSIEITLDKDNNAFSFTATPSVSDPGLQYLIKYNFYKELINFYNLENPKDQLPGLYESFALIGSYRNYHNFNPSVSLQNAYASRQIQDIRVGEFNKSMNVSDQSEPSVFNLVRLRVAEKHYDLMPQGFTNEECETLANSQPFLKSINDKLKIVNLRVEIKLREQRTWDYSFEFLDTRRDNKPISNINSLSAGQKSIIHLVFEAYGRGNLHGGLVIIDEPEIHLHHQFQDEYIRVIEELNKDQKCQYVLVTHSESLINSNTINKVQRFALDTESFTIIKSPSVTADQKTLVKILDNTRSAYAFFASKIVFVEGDTDRYFFKAVFQELKPELNQSVAVLHMNGKGSYSKWKSFFEDFGLHVNFICDFDNVFTLSFSAGTLVNKKDKAQFEDDIKQSKLNILTVPQKTELARLHKRLSGVPTFLSSPTRKPWKALIDYYLNLVKTSNAEMVAKTKSVYTDIDKLIEEKYPDNIYILKKGSIESYIGTSHGDMEEVIKFCNKDLSRWLKSGTDESLEIIEIINQVSSKVR